MVVQNVIENFWNAKELVSDDVFNKINGLNQEQKHFLIKLFYQKDFLIKLFYLTLIENLLVGQRVLEKVINGLSTVVLGNISIILLQ